MSRNSPAHCRRGERKSQVAQVTSVACSPFPGRGRGVTHDPGRPGVHISSRPSRTPTPTLNLGLSGDCWEENSYPPQGSLSQPRLEATPALTAMPSDRKPLRPGSSQENNSEVNSDDSLAKFLPPTQQHYHSVLDLKGCGGIFPTC